MVIGLRREEMDWGTINMSESLVFDIKRKQIKRMFAEVSHSQETASHTDLLTFAQAVRICPV
jgi:hypothetical protein